MKQWEFDPITGMIRSLVPVLPAPEGEIRCAICKRRDEEVMGEWWGTYVGEGEFKVRVEICPDCRRAAKAKAAGAARL